MNILVLKKCWDLKLKKKVLKLKKKLFLKIDQEI